MRTRIHLMVKRRSLRRMIARGPIHISIDILAVIPLRLPQAVLLLLVPILLECEKRSDSSQTFFLALLLGKSMRLRFLRKRGGRSVWQRQSPRGLTGPGRRVTDLLMLTDEFGRGALCGLGSWARESTSR